jgi:hypothetical protein
MEGLIERYVLHESYPTGNVQLESLESMQGRIAEGMRTSNDAVKNTLAPYIAADMCTRCVETVQLVLDVPKILDGPKDNNIIRDDTEHFIGGYPEDNVR